MTDLELLLAFLKQIGDKGEPYHDSGDATRCDPAYHSPGKYAHDPPDAARVIQWETDEGNAARLVFDSDGNLLRWFG